MRTTDTGRTLKLDGAMLQNLALYRYTNELARISADASEEQPVQVLVTQARNQVLFQVIGKGAEARGGFQRVELVSQLIDARFPDYNAIVPKSFDTRTIVDTASMLKAVRVASLFARDNSNIIKVGVQPPNGDHNGQMRLTATSTESGDNVNEIDASVEGDELEIAFNAKYLIDVLSQIEEPQIVLETTQSTRPGAIRPIGVGEEEFLKTEPSLKREELHFPLFMDLPPRKSSKNWGLKKLISLLREYQLYSIHSVRWSRLFT